MLIVGCGDVGQRVARRLLPRVRVLALVRSPERASALRGLGVHPLAGDLDDAASLHRLAGLATRVLHLAPPEGDVPLDGRTHALAAALMRRSAPAALVYGSTSGVYGDCAGAWVDECRPPAPRTVRASARLNAERHLRALGRTNGTRVSILRIAAIHAPDRVATDRQPAALALIPAEDVFTNRIDADDLARACLLALWRGKSQRICNASDGQPLKMGDWLDRLADQRGQPHPTRITRAEAVSRMSPQRLSFMGESRRLLNRRLVQELRLSL